MYRYVITEYYFEDDSNIGRKNILGSYESMRDARAAAGKYITDNVKKKKEKYRDWHVQVNRELVFFPIPNV